MTRIGSDIKSAINKDDIVNLLVLRFLHNDSRSFPKRLTDLYSYRTNNNFLSVKGNSLFRKFSV